MSQVRTIVVGIALLASTAPLQAQSMQGMDHSSMPGMAKPMQKKSAAAPKPPAAKKPVAKPSVDPMQGMDHSNMPGMERPKPQPSPVADCTPEHARMGHCSLAETTVEQKAAGTANPTDHTGPGAMPGMQMPEASKTEVATDPDCPAEHAKMGHCTPKTAAQPEQIAIGTNLEPGNAPAPAPPSDWAADRFYSPAEMARSRDDMMKENGAQTVAFLSFNLAEYQARAGADGFRWDGEGWYGGDINRLTVKTEGEGVFGTGIETAEVQLLYSRAIDPYFNLQAGVRQDWGKGPRRTYATVGFEGLAPYWFEVEGALFVSNKGDVLGRVSGYYDQRITQRLVLQPRAEFNFAAQTIRESDVGSGLSDVELGLRLRYEVVKEFAPYIGVEWARKAGNTARFARAKGEDPNVTNFVAGIRFWF